MYKYSFYNFLIPDPQGQFYLLYNSLHNGLYEITKDQFNILLHIEKEKFISIKDFEILDDSFKVSIAI
jgi:hypothetical protein